MKKNNSIFDIIMSIIGWSLGLYLLLAVFQLLAKALIEVLVVSFTTANGFVGLLLLLGFLAWRFDLLKKIKTNK